MRAAISEILNRRMTGARRALTAAATVALVCSLLPAFVAIDDAGADEAGAASIPTITGVSPGVGEKYPGWNSDVTITGSGFNEVLEVKFGSKQATAWSKNTEGTVLSALTPKGATPGRVDIRLRTSAGWFSSASPAEQFVFVAPIPKISTNSYPDPDAYYYDFDCENCPVANFSDWMADPRLIPDTAKLSDLSLPGTHDTGAYPTRSIASQTQTMNVPTQLASGIRALDVRVGQRASGLGCSDTLHLFHSNDCYDTFQNELNRIATFLRAHPSELVVMRLGTAGTPLGGRSETELASEALTMLEGVSDVVYWGASDNPTVAELRGSIFVLSQFDADGNALLPGRPYGDVDEQDHYKVIPVNQIRDKWDSIQKKFDETSASTGPTIHLNHISAAQGASPCTFASGFWSCTGVPNILDPGGNPKLQTLLTYGYAGTCNLSSDCKTMVERGLYQLKLCLPGVKTSICSAYYEGLNMMAQAYIAGSSPSGTTVPWNPGSARRRPAFPGVTKAGIVMMDFPGKNLITAVIGANRGANSVTAYLDPDISTAESNGWAHNGWYTRPVDVKLRCSGIYYASCPTDAAGNPAVIDTLRQDGHFRKSKSVQVSDGSGNAVASPVVYAFIDTRAPLVEVPASFDVNATTATGVPVQVLDKPDAPPGSTRFELSFPPDAPPRQITMSDATSGLDAASCTLPVGTSDLPVGTTTVSCTATDGAGLTTTRSFDIRVRATVAATPSSPPNENGWYTSKPVVVGFTCTGTGGTCPADQSFADEGTTTSNATATAVDGTQVTSNVVPIKIDTLPPTIDTAPLSVDATTPNGAFVDLASAASDLNSGVQAVTCAPLASSALFPIGDQVTSCWAQDLAGNFTEPASLTIHVRGAAEQALNLAQAASVDQDLAAKADQVVAAIDQGRIADACTDLGVFYTALRSATGLGPNAVTLESMVANLAGVLGGCPFQSGTTTIVSVNPVGARTGQPVTLTAVVAPPSNSSSASLAGGKVQFFADGSPLGQPVAVKRGSIGTATKTVTFGASSWPGTVSAHYLGTAKNGPSSSGSVSLDLRLAETTTSLVASSALAPYGAPVALKAQVSVVSPGRGTPGGSVEFYEGQTKIGTALLSKGTATLPVTLSVGLHPGLQARYVGPDAYNVSLSGTTAVEVQKAATATTLSIPPTISGSSVTVTASVKSVKPSTGVPTGTVSFSLPSGPLGSPVSLDATGRASFVVPNVGAGKLKLSVDYQGSDNFNPSSVTKSTTLTVDATTALLRGTGPEIRGDEAMQGSSVAMSGDILVVGAPGWDNPSVAPSNQGAVYVFQKPVGGSWTQATQVARLTLSNASSPSVGGQRLGLAVAVDGDTIVAGATYNVAQGLHNSPAVYVFTKPTGGWTDGTETAQLRPSNPSAFESFGVGHGRIAISGGHIVVGAPGHAPGGVTGQGAVYVFDRPSSGWVNATESAFLTASDGGQFHGLGRSVGISGSMIVAGAPGAPSAAHPELIGAGAVYVFTASGGTWSSGTESAQLRASDADAMGPGSGSLGESVAVSGSTVVAGAVVRDGYGSDRCTGAAYVFTAGLDGFTSGTETAQVNTQDLGDCFSPVVALDGPRLVVRTDPDVSNPTASSIVDLFTADASGSWTHAKRFTATAETAGLGTSLAVTADAVAMGAPYADWTYPDSFTAANAGVVLISQG
jgi:hypothetical protein